MPTPSHAFREEYERHENRDSLSISTSYKRFLDARKKNPSLIPERFFEDSNHLMRQRARVTLQIGDKGELALITVCRELTKYGLTEGGVRARLDRFWEKHPEERSFESLEALWLRLEMDGEAGIANPVRVDGVYFHNLAALARARNEEKSVSPRTASQRVAEIKLERGLATKEILDLTEQQFRDLMRPKDTRLPFGAFANALEIYVQEYGLQLIAGDADMPTPCDAKAAYASYENNRTEFSFLCKACVSKDPSVRPFQKAMSHWLRQGCPVCAEADRRKKRKLPAQEVRDRISQHPAGIEWVDDDTAYVNNTSKLTVRCRDAGHVFKRVAQEFFEEGKIKYCPLCFNGRLGETIAVATSNYLLGTGLQVEEVREVTPPHLRELKQKGNPLRHDGYFALEQPPIKIAIEHMGSQHFDPHHSFHVKSPYGKKESFESMQNRDMQKRMACERAGVFYIDLPDLVDRCFTLDAAARFVAEELVSRTQGVVLEIPGFETRQRELSDASFVKALVLNGSMSLPEVRLQKQLDEEDSPVEIADYDNLLRRFTLRCRNHPDQKPWSALATNAIGSAEYGRKGTRCPACKSDKRAKERRLTEEEIDTRAHESGFERAFEYGDYARNSQALAWRCLRDTTHIVEVSLLHLERGCRYCKKGNRSAREAGSSAL